MSSDVMASRLACRVLVCSICFLAVRRAFVIDYHYSSI